MSWNRPDCVQDGTHAQTRTQQRHRSWLSQGQKGKEDLDVRPILYRGSHIRKRIPGTRALWYPNMSGDMPSKAQKRIPGMLLTVYIGPIVPH